MWVLRSIRETTYTKIYSSSSIRVSNCFFTIGKSELHAIPYVKESVPYYYCLFWLLFKKIIEHFLRIFSSYLKFKENNFSILFSKFDRYNYYFRVMTRTYITF